MLKRLLAVVVVLLIAAATAVPAFGQTADINGWGERTWLVNMFGDPATDSLTEFCAAASPSAASWAAIFPVLIDECGWVLAPVEESPSTEESTSTG